MSPLVGSPNRGYADWQRVSNWDSGIVWSPNAGPIAGPTTSPVLDVSRYAYVTGVVNPITNPVGMILSWYADSGATIQVGSRTVVLSPLVGDVLQMRLPNLGPFLVITLTSIGGLAYTVNGRIFLTNRYHPLEFIPRSTLIVTTQIVSLPVGGSVVVYPLDYYAGSIQVWNDAAGGTSHYGLQALDTAGNWNDIVYLPTPSTPTLTVWSAPTGAWRLYIENNSGGALSFTMAITASATGAT